MICGSKLKYGDNAKDMPRDRPLFDMYCLHLGLDRKDFDALFAKHGNNRLFVSTKHFDPVDIGDDGALKEGSSQSDRVAVPIIGDKRKWKGVMIPAATVRMIRNDMRFQGDDCSSSSASKTPMSSSSRTSRGSRSSLRDVRKESLDNSLSIENEHVDRLVYSVESSEPTQTPKRKRGYTYRRRSKPHSNTIVADQFNIVSGMLEIDVHAQKCGTGTLQHKSRRGSNIMACAAKLF